MDSPLGLKYAKLDLINKSDLWALNIKFIHSPVKDVLQRPFLHMQFFIFQREKCGFFMGSERKMLNFIHAFLPFHF